MRGEGETKLGMRKPSPTEGNPRGLLGSENRGLCANPMVLAPCVVQVGRKYSLRATNAQPGNRARLGGAGKMLGCRSC